MVAEELLADPLLPLPPPPHPTSAIAQETRRVGIGMGVKGWPLSWPKASDLLSLSSALGDSSAKNTVYTVA